MNIITNTGLFEDDIVQMLSVGQDDIILDLESEDDAILDDFAFEEPDGELSSQTSYTVSADDSGLLEMLQEESLGDQAAMPSPCHSQMEIASNEEPEHSEEPGDLNSEEGEEVGDTKAEPTEKLENLVLSFLSQLSVALTAGGNKTQKERGKQRIVLKIADRKKIMADGSFGTRTLKFPQKSKGASIKPFAQLLRVADLMHEALVDDIPTTKRNMYYKDIQFFKSQSVVDRLVDDLAATFKLGRSDLHVRASAKGMLCGAGLAMHLKEGDVLNSQDSEGLLIPAAEQIIRFEVSEELAWVLIVEKEAVFQTLCRLGLVHHADLPGPGVIITGKGYPDVATRQLVRTLSDNLPATIPILALVDGDAYGIDILSVYKYGSTSMSHENASLAASRVRWIGIWASELTEFGVPKDALLPITKHDEKKAYSMLRRHDLPRKWRKELQYTLHSRRKAEIEVLCSAAFVAHYRAPQTPDEREMFVDSEHEDCATMSTRSSRELPLLKYLVPKIATVVESQREFSGAVSSGDVTSVSFVRQNYRPGDAMTRRQITVYEHYVRRVW